jgi:hypothetical protein
MTCKRRSGHNTQKKDTRREVSEKPILDFGLPASRTPRK